MATFPILFAHRGASGYEYENTITSFDKGIELGANGIETDCWALIDGSVAVHHDKFISRSGKSPILISKITKSEISAISLPNGDSVPLIDEVFSRYQYLKDLDGNLIQFSIDLQDTKVGLILAPIIEDFNLENRVYLCSENLNVLAKVRKSHPKIMLIASNIRKLVLKPKFPSVQNLHSLNIDAINLQAKNVTPHLCMRIRVHGYKVFIWDLHTRESLEKGLDFNPAAIYTDYPDIAVQVINQKMINNSS